MPFGAQLGERLQAKTVLLLAGAIATLSAGLASLVPRDCFALFAALMTGGMGLCIGLSYTTPIKLGWKAMPERSGMVSGLIIGGFGLGSLIFTQLGTMIINPDNLSQITVTDSATNMTTEAFPEVVAERVPKFLQWLALGYACLALLAQILIQEVKLTDK